MFNKEYDILNNTLYSGISTSVVSLPNKQTLVPTVYAGDGNLVSVNFGNGVFKSGVWENGVWNNGFRSSEWFNSLDFLRISDVIRDKAYKMGESKIGRAHV